MGIMLHDRFSEAGNYSSVLYTYHRVVVTQKQRKENQKQASKEQREFRVVNTITGHYKSKQWWGVLQ